MLPILLVLPSTTSYPRFSALRGCLLVVTSDSGGATAGVWLVFSAARTSRAELFDVHANKASRMIFFIIVILVVVSFCFGSSGSLPESRWKYQRLQTEMRNSRRKSITQLQETCGCHISFL